MAYQGTFSQELKHPKKTPLHSHSLSIDTVSSIGEPSTPSRAGLSPKSCLWNLKMADTNSIMPYHISKPSSNNFLTHNYEETSGSDKENGPVYGYRTAYSPAIKIDKIYLLSISRTPVRQLRSMIIPLAKDQHGCRLLQKQLDERFVHSTVSRQSNFAIIFEQVKFSLYELIIDPFGNYLVQKLIEYFDESDLDFCLETLNCNLFSISINQHGTRAVQRLIDKISTNSQYIFLRDGMQPYIIELIKDINGNHVIQKVLKNFPAEKCQFIYNSILADVLEVAKHKQGCCVLQKCLNHVTDVQHAEFSRILLAYEIFSCLVNDQFGNYVLQYLVSVNSIKVNQTLLSNILAYGVSDLCVLKYSSNVVEKLIISCYDNEIDSLEFSTSKFTLISHILNGDLNRIVNNAFGNYVVQTLTDTLINPGTTYFVDLPAGQRMLLPALTILLGNNFQSSVDTLQVQIIKRWFQNTRIESSFGRKIQSKLRIIMNGAENYPEGQYLHKPLSLLDVSFGNDTMPSHYCHGQYQSLKALRSGANLLSQHIDYSAIHLHNFTNRQEIFPTVPIFEYHDISLDCTAEGSVVVSQFSDPIMRDSPSVKHRYRAYQSEDRSIFYSQSSANQSSAEPFSSAKSITSSR